MSNPHFFFRTGGFLVQITPEDILFLEAADNYTHFSFTDKQRITIRITLQEALNLLPKHLFIRIHRSYAVGAKYIAAITRDELYFEGVDGFTLPISKQYYASFGKQVTILETPSSNGKEQGEETITTT
jgi:DNA-binding LytR/AlgR family response regulator